MEKCLGTSEKCEILHGGRLEYFGQVLYWALWHKINHIQMKNRNPIGAGIWYKLDSDLFEYDPNRD
jgi:hypothetical protein